MTREDAIYTLRGLFIPCASDGNKWGCDRNEALDMAIEALSADAVSREMYDDVVQTIIKREKQFTNMVSVVRCKDCRWWNSETKGCKRNPSVEAWYETDFCKYGERQCNYFGERREP